MGPSNSVTLTNSLRFKRSEIQSEIKLEIKMKLALALLVLVFTITITVSEKQAEIRGGSGRMAGFRDAPAKNGEEAKDARALRVLRRIHYNLRADGERQRPEWMEEAMGRSAMARSAMARSAMGRIVRRIGDQHPRTSERS